MEKETKFDVYTWQCVNKDTPDYAHWSEGLKMSVTKNGKTIILESEEIQQLVKSLPKTIGGTY